LFFTPCRSKRFNSHSSNIDAIQNHYGNPGKVKKSSSVDHPDILFHNVKKPVIQEIKEIITRKLADIVIRKKVIGPMLFV